MLAEFSVDQGAAVGIAVRGVVVENHIKPFPWILFAENPGKRFDMVLHNPASPRNFDCGFSIHTKFC